MKVLIVVVLVIYIAFLGSFILFTEKGLQNVSANTVVQIDRQLRFATDSTLKIACEKAILDYEKRTVMIEGLVSFAGNKATADNNEWVVEKMKIQDNKLVIHIPPDANYEIRIGPQFHLLPKISK